MKKNIWYNLLVILSVGHGLHSSEGDKELKREISQGCKLIKKVPMGFYDNWSGCRRLAFEYPLVAFSCAKKSSICYSVTLWDVAQDKGYTEQTLWWVEELAISRSKQYFAYAYRKYEDCSNRELCLLNCKTNKKFTLDIMKFRYMAFLENQVDTLKLMEQLEDNALLPSVLNHIVIDYVSMDLLAVLDERGMSVYSLGTNPLEKVHRIEFPQEILRASLFKANQYNDIAMRLSLTTRSTAYKGHAVWIIRNCLQPQAKFVCLPMTQEFNGISSVPDSRKFVLNYVHYDYIHMCDMEDEAEEPKLVPQELPIKMPAPGYWPTRLWYCNDKTILAVRRRNQQGVGESSLRVKYHDDDRIDDIPIQDTRVCVSDSHVVVADDNDIYLYELMQASGSK